MVGIGLGKGQGLAYEAGQPLTQGVVPTLHVSCLTAFFADTAMGCFGKDLAVRFPEVAEGQTLLVRLGNLVPQTAARLLAAVTNHKGYNLSCPVNRVPDDVKASFLGHYPDYRQ